jgi:hypothetical protein
MIALIRYQNNPNLKAKTKEKTSKPRTHLPHQQSHKETFQTVEWPERHVHNLAVAWPTLATAAQGPKFEAPTSAHLPILKPSQVESNAVAVVADLI